MNMYVVFLGTVFAALSSAMIAYIAMATMIGPWIAPTLVLISTLLLSLRKRKRACAEQHREVALIQSIGSVGGIIGMGVGFSVPTLYFLNPDYFASWMQAPVQFCALMAAVSLAAGAFGMWLARMFAPILLHSELLSFPVSRLIYQSLASQSQARETKQLFAGMGATALLCLLRDGFGRIPALLPKTFYIVPAWLGSAVPITLFPGPTLWAIGFSTGTIIAVPLLVGILSKYLVLWPLQYHNAWLPFALFGEMASESFEMAFCSGLVLAEAVLGIFSYPRIIKRSIVSYWNARHTATTASGAGTAAHAIPAADAIYHANDSWFESTRARVYASGTAALSVARNLCVVHVEFFVALLTSVMVLKVLGFSLLSQLVLLVLAAIATYQICYLGGKVGLLPFGRFSTFVMVPLMLMFGITHPLQITFLCVFVNIASGVAADLLFDYKVGELCDVQAEQVHRYQWLGLIVTSLCIGFFLWLIFTNFQLGSAELFAQRGKSRALLIQSLTLNPYVMGCGLLFGVILSKLRVNPSLVMGGILMPNGISIGLMLGGFFSKLFKQPENQASFWSGVFACESLWILLGMLTKLSGLV